MTAPKARSATGSTEWPPARLVLDTALGEVHIELLPAAAPLTVMHVRELLPTLGEGTFYRAQRSDHIAPGREFEVLQGGWMLTEPTVAHETSIPHELGTVSLARLAPGTAATEFFVCLSDRAPALDVGAPEPMDGHGYVVFGRVIDGIGVLQEIHQRPTDDEAPTPLLQGQMLTDPIPFTARLS